MKKSTNELNTEIAGVLHALSISMEQISLDLMKIQNLNNKDWREFSIIIRKFGDRLIEISSYMGKLQH